MGIGSARGDNRAVEAAEHAISSPLLEQSMDGARGVLLSIAGGSDLGLFEINEAAQLVTDAAHPDANIIFGAVIDDALGDEVRVTVIAAGFDSGTPSYKPAETGQEGQRPRVRPSRLSARAPGRPAQPAPTPAAARGGCCSTTSTCRTSSRTVPDGPARPPDESPRRAGGALATVRADRRRLRRAPAARPATSP